MHDEGKRLPNQVRVYEYGSVLKVMYFKHSLLPRGYEQPQQRSPRNVDSTKCGCNLSRAKAAVNELGLCNEWEYFCTFTIDGAKYARDDLCSYYKTFSKWLNNYNTRHDCKVQYLLIPELHADKVNWHMHGLLRGLPERALSHFDSATAPLSLCNANYLNWNDYAVKFGFCSLGKIKSVERVSAYITKYITKAMWDNHIALGNHLYYCSKGLQRRKELYTTTVIDDSCCMWDYENEYFKVKTVRSVKELEYMQLKTINSLGVD